MLHKNCLNFWNTSLSNNSVHTQTEMTDGPILAITITWLYYEEWFNGSLSVQQHFYVIAQVRGTNTRTTKNYQNFT